MTEEQKASVLNARVTCAMIRAMGMQAENALRERKGEALAYNEQAFLNIIAEEDISWNAIYKLLYQ